VFKLSTTNYNAWSESLLTQRPHSHFVHMLHLSHCDCVNQMLVDYTHTHAPYWPKLWAGRQAVCLGHGTSYHLNPQLSAPLLYENGLKAFIFGGSAPGPRWGIPISAFRLPLKLGAPSSPWSAPSPGKSWIRCGCICMHRRTRVCNCVRRRHLSSADVL